jgi:hypothetical protein
LPELLLLGVSEAVRVDVQNTCLAQLSAYPRPEPAHPRPPNLPSPQTDRLPAGYPAVSVLIPQAVQGPELALPSVNLAGRPKGSETVRCEVPSR